MHPFCQFLHHRKHFLHVGMILHLAGAKLDDDRRVFLLSSHDAGARHLNVNAVHGHDAVVICICIFKNCFH